MSHSPFPWSTHPQVTSAVFDADGKRIVDAWHPIDPDTAADNAAIIAAIPAMIEALKGLITAYDNNVCEHEVTHRGGSIWTICDGCGQKWADDEGGFKPYCDPVEVIKARAVLASIGKNP